MKPIHIKKVLDLAKAARKQNRVFNPLFVGDAGLGKSFITQQWVDDQKKENPNFGFLDLRVAYLEAPDLIGYPEVKDGRTHFNLPSIWPTEGEGLILLEEVNRGKQDMMNALMQLLTDRKIHEYHLPEGWIIAGAINPDDGNYDVNGMDTALKNRFEEYVIEYDHKSFIDYVKIRQWHPNVVSFLNSGTWVYTPVGSCGDKQKYISPRTWEKLNNAEFAGVSNDADLYLDTCVAILGRDIGKAYYSFIMDQKPITYDDYKKNKKKALEQIKTQASKDGAYRGDLISVTTKSFLDAIGKVKIEDIDELRKVLPVDQAVNLVMEFMIGTTEYEQKNGKNNDEAGKIMDKQIEYFKTADAEFYKELVRSEGRLSDEKKD